MGKEEIQSIAFQLIAYSGEAFDHYYKSIDLARLGEIEHANNEIKIGNSKLTKAHNSQRELLTAEARNENIEFSIILVHAQDHLMTTIMFERVAKEFIQLYDERRK
ncbi:PTS lactose/cellobiose transporter subunit IIA [Candidatus Stoquefichus massiliensis]|uniref:PTS lactose/cellobiose transporter subunit IIA n=1 Tax=Candidatus Stoquefichus massiliensis TaxID=1470350 RepID=UPI0004881E5D|nr:PTS lactose/cellobiose transporter subunit IIA [Candidatus Stoquefichus massiliensis]